MPGPSDSGTVWVTDEAGVDLAFLDAAKQVRRQRLTWGGPIR
jgi:hypothetical protein